MRPGLTCLWAVSGRDNVDFETWMKMDMQYIDNWSLALDWKILLLTIPRVLTGRGSELRPRQIRMHLIPTQDEVVRVLRETGALRDGHFEYPSGLHSNEYLQVPLAMRYYQHQRMLSVGLSRLLRANSGNPRHHPGTLDRGARHGGTAGGLRRCEALRAKQVYWAGAREQRASRCASASIWSSIRASRWCWWTIFCAPAANWRR